MFITLPDAVLRAIQTLNNAGYEAYVVGGCVRDVLLGKNPTDWDITTSATPDEMLQIFTAYRTIKTGIQHGTVTVIVSDTPLEITTYRIDGEYTDGRHPDTVSFTRSLAEDLRRRDFTINAMAYHPSNGLVDLYNGQNDLISKTIRCVGDSECRFTEDALRILRALRFASTLGFAIDRNTDAALRRLSPTLMRVAVERIYTEWSKLLCGQDASRIVMEYADVMSVFVPEIHSLHNTALINMVEKQVYTRISALMYCADISPVVAENILWRLRADAQTIERVKLLLSCRAMPMKSDVDLLRLLNRLDESLIFDYLALSEAESTVFDRVHALISSHACYKVSMLSVDGNDILCSGVPAGPQVGAALEYLLEAVIDGRCSNTFDDLLKYLNTREKPVQ